MCVYHEQPDMYDHLLEYCGASEHVQNNNSQTPVLLAASIGKIAMLQHIYNKKRKVWCCGNACCALQPHWADACTLSGCTLVHAIMCAACACRTLRDR
jgi:hypothetical protein